MNAVVAEKRWFVLYTAPRAEKKVADRFRAEAVEVYLPLVREKRKWSDRIKLVELPLYPSYLFIHCTEYDLRNKVLSFRGVVGFVRYNARPAVLRDPEIDSIREFVRLCEGNQIIAEGDVVSILSGPFEKVSGKVVRLTVDTACLYIEALGATVYVKLENIEKF